MAVNDLLIGLAREKGSACNEVINGGAERIDIRTAIDVFEIVDLFRAHVGGGAHDFFFFALIVSLANAIFSVKLIPTAFRYIIHYVLCAFAFYLCVLFPVNTSSYASFVLIGLSLFTVVYVIVCVLISIFKSKAQQKKEKKETYKNQFSK